MSEVRRSGQTDGRRERDRERERARETEREGTVTTAAPSASV